MRIKMILLLVAMASFVSFGSKITGVHRAKWGKSLTVGAMSRDDFFRQLSERYYGTTEFAEELALVNRALEFRPLEKIKSTDLIIPDQGSIFRLRAKQTMKIALNEKPPMALRQQHQSLNWFVMQLIFFFIGFNQMILPVLAGTVALILLLKLIRAFRVGKPEKSGYVSPATKFAKNSDRILVEFDVTQLNKKP
ncbi:MAG: hypothetical protein GXO74_04010 [Calditrichaeota bacterium]|nr:hypothetical protein [Calditrichota bacterium]